MSGWMYVSSPMTSSELTYVSTLRPFSRRRVEPLTSTTRLIGRLIRALVAAEFGGVEDAAVPPLQLDLGLVERLGHDLDGLLGDLLVPDFVDVQLTVHSISQNSLAAA